MLLNFSSFFLQRKFSSSHHKEYILLIEIQEEKWPKLGLAIGVGVFVGCRERIEKGDPFAPASRTGFQTLQSSRQSSFLEGKTAFP